MVKKNQHINLLRHQEKSAVDKFLDWAFTIGRAIVIITESIALSAFAYRFILDRQIIDLKDKIKQEQAIVRLSEPNELKFRNLQDRLEVIKILDEKSTSKTSVLAEILKRAQGKISFSAIAITDKAVSMEGVVSSARIVPTFVQELRSIPRITKVTIGEVANNTTTGIVSVGLQAELAQASKPVTPGQEGNTMQAPPSGTPETMIPQMEPGTGAQPIQP